MRHTKPKTPPTPSIHRRPKPMHESLYTRNVTNRSSLKPLNLRSSLSHHHHHHFFSFSFFLSVVLLLYNLTILSLLYASRETVIQVARVTLLCSRRTPLRRRSTSNPFPVLPSPRLTSLGLLVCLINFPACSRTLLLFQHLKPPSRPRVISSTLSPSSNPRNPALSRLTPRLSLHLDHEP